MEDVCVPGACDRIDSKIPLVVFCIQTATIMRGQVWGRAVATAATLPTELGEEHWTREDLDTHFFVTLCTSIVT
jgi:hypothetical protein